MGFNNSDLTTGSDPAFPQAMPASWPCVDAWYEQRMFILNAVQALVAGKSPCAPPMTKAMAEISPSWASGADTKKPFWAPLLEGGIAGFSDEAIICQPRQAQDRHKKS